MSIVDVDQHDGDVCPFIPQLGEKDAAVCESCAFSAQYCRGMSVCREVDILWYAVTRAVTELDGRTDVSLRPRRCPTSFWVLATTQPGRTPRSLPSPQTRCQDAPI